MHKISVQFMLEGRKNFDSHRLSAQDSFSMPQGDTLRSITQPNVNAASLSQPAVSQKKYSNAQVDSLFMLSDRRDSQIKAAKNNIPVAVQNRKEYQQWDTIATRYHPYNYPFSSPNPVVLPNKDNFLLNIQHKTLIQPQQKTDRHINLAVSDTTITKPAQILLPAQGFMNGTVRAESGMNWLILTLLVSLFAFSWMQMVYEKFIIQIVGSIINYQISYRLFRERNVLFKNISLGLNFIFSLNLGVFIFYLLEYYELNHVFSSKFLSMLAYTFGILLIYAIKSGVCKSLGYIFLVREEFDEYIHNIRLFNKNIGLFLLPIIVVFPFIHESIKPYILYAGLLVIGTLILLRIYRGFQIIMKKGVTIFYLILYLCAVEILPVLLMIKIAASLN